LEGDEAAFAFRVVFFAFVPFGNRIRPARLLIKRSNTEPLLILFCWDLKRGFPVAKLHQNQTFSSEHCDNDQTRKRRLESF